MTQAQSEVLQSKAEAQDEGNERASEHSEKANEEKRSTLNAVQRHNQHNEDK